MSDRPDPLEPARELAADPAPDPATLLRQLEGRLADVQAALGRLEDGSYGRCRACGREIEDELLVADPAVVLCAACGKSEG